MNIKPIGNRILIEHQKLKDKTKGGIYLPNEIEKEKQRIGKVLALGEKIIIPIKKGNLVLFTEYGPNEIEIEERKYLILKEDDVLAVLE